MGLRHPAEHAALAIAVASIGNYREAYSRSVHPVLVPCIGTHGGHVPVGRCHRRWALLGSLSCTATFTQCHTQQDTPHTSSRCSLMSIRASLVVSRVVVVPFCCPLRGVDLTCCCRCRQQPELTHTPHTLTHTGHITPDHEVHSCALSCCWLSTVPWCRSPRLRSLSCVLLSCVVVRTVVYTHTHTHTHMQSSTALRSCCSDGHVHL